ncbi:hypothetical protein JCM10450v2_003422 [Rhodotorula kratochvilovae]
MVPLLAILLYVSTLALASSAQLLGASSSSSSSSCVSGSAVHIIVARASTEPAGEGIIGQVATMVKRQLTGSTSEAISYPATLYPYLSSEAAGVKAMTAAIEAYTQRCPESKLVLMGYSQRNLTKAPLGYEQGAHVVGDTLCGSSSAVSGFGSSTGGLGALPLTSGSGSGMSQGGYLSGFGNGLSTTAAASSPWSFSGLSRRALSHPARLSPSSPSSSATAHTRVARATNSSNIVAALQMGDPSFVPGASIDAGTSTTKGLFARSSAGVACLEALGTVKSYCDAGDEFCASGASLPVHLSYVQKYGQEAAAWIVAQAKA